VSDEQAQEATALADPVLSPEASPKALRQAARKKAMDLLARREHSVAELQQKLVTKGHDADIVTEVLGQLEQEGLLSDDRFTEAFVRYRRKNGYGPHRIQSELRQRGVSEKMQAAYLEVGDPQWFEQAAQVRQKRFGGGLPEDFKERAKQARFLQYRGFTGEQIREVMDDV